MSEVFEDTILRGTLRKARFAELPGRIRIGRLPALPKFVAPAQPLQFLRQPSSALSHCVQSNIDTRPSVQFLWINTSRTV